jgi:hypothetical protein
MTHNIQTMGDKTMEGLHEIDHNLPEECLLYLSDQLPWSFHNIYTCLRERPYFQATIGLVNEQGERTRSAQGVKAFESYKRCLQVLSLQTGQRVEGDHWVLKCPLHCFFVKELVEVFPDAKLIWCVPHAIKMLTLTPYTATSHLIAHHHITLHNI